MSQSNDHILVICSREENRRSLKVVSEFAANTLQANVSLLSFAEITREATGIDISREGIAHYLNPEGTAYRKELLAATAEVIRAKAPVWPVQLVLTDLPYDSGEAGLEMTLATELNVDFGFVVYRNVRKIKRVVITTGGGPHALVGLQYGHKAAQSLQAEALALRIVRPGEINQREGSSEDYCNEISELITMQTEMAGVPIPVKLQVAESVEQAILKELREDDLLITGITSKWRYTSLSGSLPDEIARQAPCSVMIVYASIKEPLPLEEVFWERNILINPDVEDRWELLSYMVNCLIDDRQLPENMRARVTATVYDRESQGATSTGRGIAIPHAAMPDFDGTVGCIATFDTPIDYDGKQVEVVFLLVTPENDYQEYLAILGKIAGLAMEDTFLQRMRDAKNSTDVVRLFQVQISERVVLDNVRKN
jgi:mannitol/fructose-specific phosphotransferase system IIA component (Ntr-type)/nucleotide-binding universal stress UspA family protein